jgi:RNA polymerase sigma-70 factor, ECF subfamily
VDSIPLPNDMVIANSNPSSDTNCQIASDASLLRRFKTGEEDAATELYKRYANRLIQLANARVMPGLKRRIDPEDIVQSVFRTFFRRASLGQYEVPRGQEIWKLFLVIGLNKIREVADHHHAAKRDLRRTTGGDAIEDQGEGDSDIALATLRMTIDELLTPLSKSYREIVELRIEQHEVAEIAKRTNRSKRSVERILHEFQQKLHGLIDAK